MNWTDFIIAIKRGLIPSKKELVDGTTQVGNAKTLDGHGAEDFFPKSGGDIKGNISLVSESAEYRSYRLINSNRDIFIRIRNDGEFQILDVTGGTTKVILASGVNGANAFSGTASGNLPLTGGGTIDGNVNVLSNGEVVRNLRVGNALRTLDIGVNTVGGGYINDVTNNEPLCEFLADGRVFFHGTSTENLPLSGGTLADNYFAPLGLTNKSADGGTWIHFNYPNETLGYLGFSSKDNLLFKTGGQTANYSIHHDGNSAKVHIGTSAPSDTGSLWVW